MINERIKFDPGNIYFNKICIVQSLKKGDRLTGQELYDDIINRRTSDSMVAEIKNITSRVELLSYFSEIQVNVDRGLFPFIHFETHGYKQGIELSNGETAQWTELTPHFLKINTATKNNLFISMAACQGGNVQFCVDITQPSPFRGFIGPMESVYEYDILNSFSDFFNVLLRENDIEKGIEALNVTARGVQYHHMNVEAFFDAALNVHRLASANNPLKKQEIVAYITDQQLKRRPDLISVFGNRERLSKSVQEFIEKDEPKVIEILRKQFCHIPLTDFELRVSAVNIPK